MLKQLEDLQVALTNYLEARLDLFKLEARERIEEGIAVAFYALSTAFVLFALLVLLQVVLALILGDWLGHAYAGFMVFIGFWGLCLLLLWVFRLRIIRAIKQLLLRLLATQSRRKSDF